MMGGMTMASGSAYSWVKNEICKIEQKMAEENGKSAYDYINEEVASAPLGANGVLFLPLLKGERSPFYNPKAKGSFPVSYTHLDVYKRQIFCRAKVSTA